MILLARHGETDDNAPPIRVQGSRDTPLNARGREQALVLAQAVAHEGIAAIWASPLARARETAEIVGAALGVGVRTDVRLAESFRGDWEGRLLSEIEAADLQAWAAWRAGGGAFRFPGGESLAEHQERVLAALAEVASGPLPALVVCHGGTVRCAAAATHPDGLAAFHELEVPNAAVIRWEGAPCAPLA